MAIGSLFHVFKWPTKFIADIGSTAASTEFVRAGISVIHLAGLKEMDRILRSRLFAEEAKADVQIAILIDEDEANFEKLPFATLQKSVPLECLRTFSAVRTNDRSALRIQWIAATQASIFSAGV